MFVEGVASETNLGAATIPIYVFHNIANFK